MPLLTSKEKCITRSFSWHQLGQNAVLEINATQFMGWSRKDSACNAIKNKPAVHSSSGSSNSSKISNRSNIAASCSKDFSSYISDEIVPLDILGNKSMKKSKTRGNGTKKRTKLVGGNASAGIGEVQQNILVKPRANKFNRSISCDDGHVRIRNSSSSSSTSSNAKAVNPRQEKVGLISDWMESIAKKLHSMRLIL